MFIIGQDIAVGDRPGYGTWRCLNCNWRVTLDDHTTPLPPCGGDCKKNAAVDVTTVRYVRLRGVVH